MKRRLNGLARPLGLGLFLLGLLFPAACAPANVHQPTLAALLALHTQSPATPAPTETLISLAKSAPTSTAVPHLTTLPSPTRLTTSPLPPNHPALYPWLLAYESDIDGNDEIYLLPADGGTAVNVTQALAEDRYPSWSPDGYRIAFQSNRDGNWEVYTLDLRTGTSKRLTFHVAYDGAPTWSSDGNWIIFESYRDTSPCDSGTVPLNAPNCPDLEIYRVPGEGGMPQRLTDNPGGDYQPVADPRGDWIAFTSWRTGDKEIFVMPANGGQARNVTAFGGDDWSPTWSRDGTAVLFLSDRDGGTDLYYQPLDGGPPIRLTASRVPKERSTSWPDDSLLFSRYDPGPRFEAHDPHRPGAYHLYRLIPNSKVPQPLLPTVKARHPAAAPLADLTTVALAAFKSRPQAQLSPVDSLSRLELRRLDDVQAPDSRLIAGADEAFRAWRSAVSQRSGFDFLGRVSDMFRSPAYYSHRLGYLSWHKTGRAVDLLFDWRSANGEKALYVVREDLAGEVYWRLFLKCATQDGSLGEPLTQAPWHFWWYPDSSKEPETDANGGRPLPIPPGYFADVTALAERYGWSRIASYHLDDFDWKRDSTATEYWHYQLTDSLTWYQAMSLIYPQELLEELFSRPVAAGRGQTDEVMDGKGLP
jgi:TolB protein